jgi:hypothetical protein
LRDGSGTAEDDTGVCLDDRTHALSRAHKVVRELNDRRGRSMKTAISDIAVREPAMNRLIIRRRIDPARISRPAPTARRHNDQHPITAACFSSP